MMDNKYNFKYIDNCLLSEYEMALNINYYRNHSLKLFERENAFVLPVVRKRGMVFEGGICDSCGNIFDESRFYPDRLMNPYKFDPEKAVCSNDTVVYAGMFWSHWGHFLIEQISRLYYFLDEKYPGIPIIYTATEPLSGNYLRLFELIGIDTARLVYVNKLTRFKKVYIPEVSTVAKTYFTSEFTRVFDFLKSRIASPKKNYDRVFYSTYKLRKNTKKDMGQIQEIEDFFALNGYKIVAPETLTLDEQIAMLKYCKDFAAVAGTLPHNLLFASQNVNAVVLNKTYKMNPYQQLINQAAGIYPVYIDTHLSFLPVHLGYGPFFFYFSDNLKKYAADNNMQISGENKPEKDYLIKFLDVYIKNLKFSYPVPEVTGEEKKILKIYGEHLQHLFPDMKTKYRRLLRTLRLMNIINIIRIIRTIIEYKIHKNF